MVNPEESEFKYSPPYNSICYDKYQIDRPRKTDRVYNKGFKPDENKPEDIVYTYSYLSGKLPTLAKLACEYVFNKKLKSGGNAYNVCIEFTKHFLCVCLCWERSSNSMYFVDIDVDLENSTSQTINVKQIKAYKMNMGSVPDLKTTVKNYTVGYTFGSPADKMPYKLPIIGISNKKLFLPRLSFFIEGPHVNLYKQNYLFDWRYADYYHTPAKDPKNIDPAITEKQKIEKAAYDYNCTTENVESGTPFNQYQFSKI